MNERIYYSEKLGNSYLDMNGEKYFVSPLKFFWVFASVSLRKNFEK